MQLSNNKIDPTNVFPEKEHQSQELQWAMGNVKSVSKKITTFYQKLVEQNLAKLSQHNAQLKNVT